MTLSNATSGGKDELVEIVSVEREGSGGKAVVMMEDGSFEDLQLPMDDPLTPGILNLDWKTLSYEAVLVPDGQGKKRIVSYKETKQ